MSNPTMPTRWSQPASVRSILNAARTVSGATSAGSSSAISAVRQMRSGREGTVLVAGTLDTKGDELRFLRDCLNSEGVKTTLVDLSTSGKPSGADVPPHQLAAFHPGGGANVFSGDRGLATAAMADAFASWVSKQEGIAGIISAAGSGGTAMAAPAMRVLPVGIPKVMISTIASGDVRPYVEASDITMMHSVADIQGLNSITRRILANGANAIVGMVKAQQNKDSEDASSSRPAIGLSMFGVTTQCVQQVTASLDADFECLVFHQTGTGGLAMEELLESGLLAGMLDITTTEICDLLFGGVLPAHPDRFGAVIRSAVPYVGSCGALDMVNFGPRSTVPEQYQQRQLYEHNPQVTLMRTTPDECAEIGRWIGQRLNDIVGPVRFLMPEGGVSSISGVGGVFHDPNADAALFDALEQTTRQTHERRLVRSPHNINDPEFARLLVSEFLAIFEPARAASDRSIGR